MTAQFNAAYLGAMQGILDGRDLEGRDIALNYTIPIAAANAFALQVAAVVGGVVTTEDEELLLMNICAAAMEGRSFTDISTSLPNSYFTLAEAINEAYTLAAANLEGGIPSPVPGVGGYSWFFALMPGDNAATVAVGAAVQFPQSGPTSTIPAAVRASASTFTITTAGTYEIDWQVSFDEAGQLQVAIGGVGLPDTVVGRATGTNQASGNAVITVAAGAVLSIINPTGNAAALTITPIAGGTHAVSATLNIKRLA